MTSISNQRKIFGWLAAYAALLPFLLSSIRIIHGLAVDGLNPPYGLEGDIVLVVGVLVASILTTGVLLLLSRMFLKSWPQYIVVFILGLFIVNATQLLAMAHSAGQIEKCGYPVCGWSEEASRFTEQVGQPKPSDRKDLSLSAASSTPLRLVDGGQVPEKNRSLKGTTFFGGSGMDGFYIEDMKMALEEAGIKYVRVADPKKWSSGGIVGDAVSVLFENNIDSEASDFSSFGEKGEQFNLVGYSYGGLQAAQGALDHADKGGTVDNLVLLATPIEKGFLKSLKDHPNIGKITVIDLAEYGDPIKAGISDAEVFKSVLILGWQFGKGAVSPKYGHFYYADEGVRGEKRRRDLAKRLKRLGLK